MGNQCGRARRFESVAAKELIVADDSLESRLRLAQRSSKDFSYKGRNFLAKVVEYYDGDTIRVKFEPAGGSPLVQHLARMDGYDSPEMKPSLANPNREKEKAAALAARGALAGVVGESGLVYISCGGFDKYGRLLVRAACWTRDGPGLNINDWMVQNGHGRPYGGGAKTPFEPRDDGGAE